MASELFRSPQTRNLSPVLWRDMGAPEPEMPAAEQQPPVAQQLELKFQEGRQRGLAEGMAAARRESEAQIQAVLERVARSIAELAETRQRLRDETADELVRLSIAIAARILHREITIDPDAVQGLLRAAFDKAQSRENVRVYTHPAHEPAVRRYVEQTGIKGKVEIVSDAALAPGSIRIETSQGQLDASVDTQLREIERGLADRMES